MQTAGVIISTAIGIAGLAFGLGNPSRTIRRYWRDRQESKASAWATVLWGIGYELAAIAAISVGMVAWVPANQDTLWAWVSGICLFAWLMLVLVADAMRSLSRRRA